MNAFSWVSVVLTSIIAGTIGGTVGFGSGVLMLPVCVAAFGARDSVPLLTIASILGNLSRVYFSWRETNWRVVLAFALGGVPSSAMGALVFVKTESEVVARILGIFLIGLVVVRRWMGHRQWKIRLYHFTLLGGVIGFLSGIVSTTGPIHAPFFLYFGLLKGAYLATEALATTTMHVTKAAVYGKFAVLNESILAKGVLLGAGMSLGSYLGKRVVSKMSTQAFLLLVEGLLVVAGVWMVFSGR